MWGLTYKLTKDYYDRKHSSSYFRDLLNKSNNNECLFPIGTFHHSEETFSADNQSWVLQRDKDLLLYPNFDYFHNLNATWLQTNGRGMIQLSRPYYQFNLDLNYFDI